VLYPFLVTLREGLEAALIIGIILAHLAKLRHPSGSRMVWLGTLSASALSLAGGAILYFTTLGHMSGWMLELFEGASMLLAVAVLTWMIFWMRSHSRTLAAHLREQVDQAVMAGSSLALAVLAFTVVVREGLETVLFLFAGSIIAGSLVSYYLGALLGLIAAATLGYGVYKGSYRLPLGVFFNLTGAMLILLAAGMVSNGLHEFHEIGIVPPLIEHVWDLSHILGDETLLAKYLEALFGYDPSPSLLQAIAYFAYLLVVAGLYFYQPLTQKLASVRVRSQ
jgi:high-affinity iron transporter